jgi:undecaprenyl diphosphate synthase
MKLTTHNQQRTIIPQHIAIIMDGNRRWAKARGLPVLAGHREVVDKILEPLIEHASERGIKYLTFWAWSTENWRRQTEEVKGIMQIFRHVIARKWQKLHKNGVRIRIIGDISQFADDLQHSLERVVEETKGNQKITTIFALNYGGRDEIIRSIHRYISQQPTTDNLQLTTDRFSTFLDTSGIPDPELIIRTGGEQRLSGFLLWQSEYSELYFPSWFMPEFTPLRLDEALEEYAKRKRNFGA